MIGLIQMIYHIYWYVCRLHIQLLYQTITQHTTWWGNSIHTNAMSIRDMSILVIQLGSLYRTSFTLLTFTHSLHTRDSASTMLLSYCIEKFHMVYHLHIHRYKMKSDTQAQLICSYYCIVWRYSFTWRSVTKVELYTVWVVTMKSWYIITNNVLSISFLRRYNLSTATTSLHFRE